MWLFAALLSHSAWTHTEGTDGFLHVEDNAHNDSSQIVWNDGLRACACVCYTSFRCIQLFPCVHN